MTYGPSDLDEETNSPIPTEFILTHKEDLCSNQSLDYLFELKKSKTIESFGHNTVNFY